MMHLARETGLLKVGTESVEGTHIKAFERFQSAGLLGPPEGLYSGPPQRSGTAPGWMLVLMRWARSNTTGSSIRKISACATPMRPP